MDYIFPFTRILCLNRSNGLKSLVLLLCFVLTQTVAVKQSDEFLNIFKKTSPFEEFKSHEVVFLRVFNGAEEINATWSSLTGGHLREITVKFTAFRLNFVLKLEQNTLLFGSNYVEKRFPSSVGEDEGFHRNHTLTNCYYNGHVVGQKAESTVALSTCNGVRGYILTGKDGYHIEPEQPTLNSKHFVFRDSDYVGRNLSCGHDNEAGFKWKAPSSHSFKKLKRSLQWPYDANDKTMVVELYIANDRSQFVERGQNVEDVLRRTKDIVNIVSSLYRPLNMYVVLVGVEVWQDEDKIEIFDNADKTMNSFLDYRRHHISPYHRNDNAQLITGRTLGDGVVGKAPIMTICTWQYSGGVNLDHSQLVGPVATTVAHEMGHNFGLTHDTEICGCPDDRCIMAPSSGGQKNPTKWSECSKQQFKDAFHQGMDYCLHNLPDQLYGSEAECGNGFTEAGEECDCGLPQDCTNPCCNATTCRLVPNATCAVGSCCDQTTCQPKPAATVCRPVKGECDLGEYCDGTSELCPSDASKHDGYECSNRGLKSYCYNGSCNTHDSQCRLLWGETGRSSHRLCFEQFNTLGTANGHCGFNWVDGKTFKKCDSRDVLCGMMHCQHRSEKLMFWKEALAYTLPESYVNINQTRLDCKSAILDVGLNMPDPGMVPDGAKCGDQKMCMKQQCRDISPFQLGKTCGNCHDHGVCNSLNQCHCDIGYAPPFCDHSGNGGSLHSGPVQIQRANVGLIVGLCVFFLLVLPLLMLLSYCGYQYRKQIKRFWMTQQGDRYRSVYRASPQQANDRQMNQIVRQPSGVGAPRIVNGTTPLPPIPVTTAVSRSPNHYHDTPKRVKGGENRGSRPNVPSNMAPSKVYQNGGLHSAVHENGEADSRLRTGQPAMDEKLVPTRAAPAPPAAVKQQNGAGAPVHGCDQNWSRKAPKRPPLPQNGQMVSSVDDPLSDAAAKSGFSSGLHVFNGDFHPHSSGKVYLHQNGSVASATNPPNNQNNFPSAHRAHNTESHGNPRIPQAKIFHQVDVDAQKPIKTRRSNGAKPSVKPATQQPSFIAQESCGSSQQPSNPQGFSQRPEVDCDAVRGNSKPTLPPKPPPAPVTRSYPKSRTNRFGVSESQC